MEEDHGWVRLRRPPDDALLDLLEVDDLIKSDVDPSDASCLCLFVRPPTQEDTTDLRRFRYLMDVYQLLSHRPIYLKADCDDASSFHYKCRNEETCQFHVKITLPTCSHRDQWRLYSDVPSGCIQVEQAYHSTWCTMVEQVETELLHHDMVLTEEMVEQVETELLHHDMVLTEELSSAILVASWRREKSASSSEVGPAELCLNVSHDRLQHAKIIFSRWTCCVRDRSCFQLWQMTTRRGDYSPTAIKDRYFSLPYIAKLRRRPEDGFIKALGKFLTACMHALPLVFGLGLYFVYAVVLPAIFVMGPYTLSRAVWGRSREMALVAEYQANGATVLGHISHRWESHDVNQETGEPVSTYGCELTYYTPNGIAVTRCDTNSLPRPPRGAGGPGVNFTVLPYNATSGMPSYMLEQFNANISRYERGVFGVSSVLLVQMGVLVAVEISARRQLSVLYSGRNVVPFSGLFTTWWVHRES
eukprot:scaffold62443_cov35-Attheya_sp.AAC.1